MKNLFVAILAAGLMAGCSSEPGKPATAETPQPQAPEAITGSGGTAAGGGGGGGAFGTRSGSHSMVAMDGAQ